MKEMNVNDKRCCHIQFILFCFVLLLLLLLLALLLHCNLILNFVSCLFMHALIIQSAFTTQIFCLLLSFQKSKICTCVVPSHSARIEMGDEIRQRFHIAHKTTRHKRYFIKMEISLNGLLKTEASAAATKTITKSNNDYLERMSA